MEWIKYIAFNKGIRGEEPNKELAQDLIDAESCDGVKEISEYLYDKNKSVASDCIAVLYHVGYQKPELISGYIETFLDLLKSKNNRMVWGGMIALSTIAKLQHEKLFDNIEFILNTVQKGSLITQIHGINTLANLTDIKDEYRELLMPVLLDYLEECRPIDFPKRAGIIKPVIRDEDEEKRFEMIIDKKMDELSEAQKKKLNKLLK